MNSIICPSNKIYNPKTKRCVLKTSVIGKKLLEQQKPSLKTKIIIELSKIRDYEARLGNFYKSKAYENVIVQFKSLNKEINNYNDVEKYIKVGEKIGLKIKSLIETGKINYEYDLENNSLYKFKQDLKDVYGIGDKKANELYNKGIRSISKLLKNDHLLNDKQKIGLKYYKDIEKRIPLDEYLLHKKVIEKELKKIPNLTYQFVGSFRRGNKDMGDIDVIIKEPSPKVYLTASEEYKNFINKLTENGYIKEILASGKVKFGGIVKLDDKYPARRLDILVSPEHEYYYSLLYFTGSADFNVGFRNHIKNKYNISLSEHGFKEEFIKIPQMKSEKDIFDFFNIKYLEPKDRIKFVS